MTTGKPSFAKRTTCCKATISSHSTSTAKAEKAKNLPAYALFPYTFSLLGIENGLVPRIWNEHAEDETLFDTLKLLGYDTLYGDALAYGDPFPFTRREMRLGLEPITVASVQTASEKEFFVTGENFTESSHVFINGRRAETLFLSENSLYVEGERLELGDTVTVVQISTDLRRLSETTPFVITDDMIN